MNTSTSSSASLDQTASLQRQSPRHVACLNNMGVSLLEKAHFREAHHTLRQAIEVFKLVSNRGPHEAGKSAADTAADASQCISRMLVSATKLCCSSHHDLPGKTKQQHLVVAGLEDLPSLCSSLNPHDATASEPTYPVVRLDDPGCYQDTAGACEALMPALVLYNCGISFLCRANAADDITSSSRSAATAGPPTDASGSSKKMRKCAIRLLNQSSCLLSLCEDSIEALFVAVFVLHAKVGAHFSCGEFEESDRCFAKMNHLRDIVIELGTSEALNFTKSVAPAA